MPASPYRNLSRPEPPLPSPPVSSELVFAGAFIWLATVARVALSMVRAEPVSRELVFAWIVLLVVPLVALWGRGR